MEDYNKYNSMEVTLHLINGMFISLSKEEIERNNAILHKLLDNIVDRMRNKDDVFRELYIKMFYGGSYFDGLKFGNPDEYDIDMILGSQKIKKPVLKIIKSDKPAFVHVEVLDDKFSPKLCYKGSKRMVVHKVKQWIQGLVQKVLNDFPYTGNGYELKSICGEKLLGKVSMQGPACTLHISGSIKNQSVDIDVDLVPCFWCFPSQWPCSKPNPCPDTGFLVVPKNHNSDVTGTYWRLSFQEQERNILKDKGKIKPALRLLKKMRDSLQQPVASYFLKTVALKEVTSEDPNFWKNKTLSYTFMRILKAYKICLKQGYIPYYWDIRYNLIERLDKVTCENFGNRLERIIQSVDRKLNDGELIASYILTSKELKRLKDKDIPAPVMQQAITEAGASSSCTII